MDQDSKFLNFEHYVKCLNSLKDTSNVALLSANTDFKKTDIFPVSPNCNYTEEFSAITSANILNLKLFNNIGKFEDKLFIDVVDFDYCVKTQLKKYKILNFKDVIVAHNLGEVFKRKNIITGKIREKREHNPQRVYYFARNYLYMAKKYGKHFPKQMGMLKVINILFIHEVTKIILYEDQKLQKLNAKFLGLYHFVIGKYGKYNI
jgi:rhamnosyltransferase